MLKKLFTLKKEDICPNCGTACFVTDILCPNCGKNLDDLFEQLPIEAFETKPFISIPKEYILLLKWVLATAIGFALGEVFLSPLAFTFVRFIAPKSGIDLHSIMIGLASGIATGIAVGAFQWFILKNYILHSWWWIFSTPLGMAGGIIIEQLFFEMGSRYLPKDIGIYILRILY